MFKGLRVLRMADTGAGTGGSSGAGGAGGGEKPWFDTFDSETKGYLQNRGWDKKTPQEAFVEAAKAHREAEKMIGAPSNEMLRLPKEANAPEWEKVHQRLGKPTDKKDYDFAAVKRANGINLDEATSDALRQWAWDANLSKDAAARMATNFVKHQDGIDSTSAALRSDKLATEKADLAKNWGTTPERLEASPHMMVAKNAAKALGIDAAAVAKLESEVGYAKVMEMFRTIGTKIGEDRFITPPNGNGGGSDGIMTRDQAIAEKNSLKRDDAWVGRYLKGGVDERRKMEALDRIISGVK